MDDSSGTPGSPPTRDGQADSAPTAPAPARRPGKSQPAKATKAVVGSKGATAGRSPAKAARATKRSGAGPGASGTRPREIGSRSRTGSSSAPASSEPSADGSIGGRAIDPGPTASGGPWRGGPRGRLTLYDRRIQRANERWSLVPRSLARLFRHPDLVLALLGKRAAVERDGRVLNRSAQALVELTNRFGGEAGGSPEAARRYDPTLMRTRLRHAAPAVMPVRTDVHVAGRVVPGPTGAPDIGLRIYRRFGSGLGSRRGGRDLLPAIVYLHGGGWVAGDLDTHDASCRMLAAASRCLVVAVDYRLAPEHPFPAAADDAVAAYAWVHRHSGELGIAEGQVGVMGDSAGGNLAAVVAQETRGGGPTAVADVPPPVAQGLVYPVADVRFDTPSMQTMGDGFLLTRDTMEYYRGEYLPHRADWETPRASPLLAGDLTGLAPALVVTAGFDPLRDDGANYAEALRMAGVDVEYRCYDDQIHGFMGMGVLSDSLALATEVCDSMGRLMRRSAPKGPPA